MGDISKSSSSSLGEWSALVGSDELLGMARRKGGRTRDGSGALCIAATFVLGPRVRLRPREGDELSSGWGRYTARAWRVGVASLYAYSSPPTTVFVTAVVFVAVECVRGCVRWCTRSARKEGGGVSVCSIGTSGRYKALCAALKARADDVA